MRVEKGGYLKHIKVSAWEQHHQRERVESSATAVISAVPTEHPLLSTVKQVEQNDALQRFSEPTHLNANTHTMQTHTPAH